MMTKFFFFASRILQQWLKRAKKGEKTLVWKIASLYTVFSFQIKFSVGLLQNLCRNLDDQWSGQVFYTPLKHDFWTNQSARYIWTL